MGDYDGDELCIDCGLPRSAHEQDYDYALDDQKEFNRLVAQHVEQKIATHRRVAALVDYKLAVAHGDTSVPRPRTPDLDSLELARAAAYEREKSYRQLVARKVQDMKIARGDAEFITPPGRLPDRQTMFGPGAKETREKLARANLGQKASLETRDASNIETRDCISSA